MTSTKASLRRYLISLRRYDMAPVACIVILDESSLYKINFRQLKRHTTARSDLIDSVVMYIFNASISEFWGYPKSNISTISPIPLKKGTILQLQVHVYNISWGRPRAGGGFTIKQLINQNKIILDALLIHLAKITPSNRIHKPMQKLKHHRRIGIDFCHRNDIYIISLDMEERR